MQPTNRILIVDDHITNVMGLEELLGDDYQLATAMSGEEALDMAPTFRPDLILLDIMMPGIDGYETCKQLRTLSELRYSKVLMVSAKAMAAERLQSYEAGADDYVTKPFNLDELKAKIRVYLRLKSLEEVDQLKSDILSLLQHETRTPLNGIMGPAELLREDLDMAANERADLLDTVLLSASRLHTLLDKVAALGAMRGGTYQWQRVSTDLVGVVRSAVCAAAPKAAANQVEIVCELSEVPWLSLDTGRVKDVISALLENAIRFSPVGGQVVIGVRHDEDYASITVSDQGVGIAPDLLPRVFDEFLSGNIRHHAEGQGLSLAVARQVVLAHNGMIRVESTPGTETTFTMQLPMVSSVD